MHRPVPRIAHLCRCRRWRVGSCSPKTRSSPGRSRCRWSPGQDCSEGCIRVPSRSPCAPEAWSSGRASQARRCGSSTHGAFVVEVLRPRRAPAGARRARPRRRGRAGRVTAWAPTATGVSPRRRCARCKPGRLREIAPGEAVALLVRRAERTARLAADLAWFDVPTRLVRAAAGARRSVRPSRARRGRDRASPHPRGSRRPLRHDARVGDPGDAAAGSQGPARGAERGDASCCVTGCRPCPPATGSGCTCRSSARGPSPACRTARRSAGATASQRSVVAAARLR